MLRFALYFAVGAACGIQVFNQVAFAILGRRTSPFEIAALAGAVVYVAAAFATPCTSYGPIRLIAVGSILLGVYYVPALLAAIHNSMRHGSSYPFAFFVPAALLCTAVVYSAVLWTKRGRLKREPTTRPREGAAGRAIVVLVVTACCYVGIWWYLGPVVIDPWIPRKTVVVNMKREYNSGDDKLRVRTLVYSGEDEDCVATLGSSEELVKYIDSFRTSFVPVTIAAFGDPPTSGIILRVGNRSWVHLGATERIVLRRPRRGAYGPIVTCLQR
jgi:hypothetical protein